MTTPTTLTLYVYAATVVSVHDGDTLVVDVDQGFHEWLHDAHLRLAGVSARELSMPGGPEARDNLAALLPAGSRVLIRSAKGERDPADTMSFDRYVITVQLPDGRDLAALLVAEQWAVWWDGRSRPIPYPPWPRTLAGGSPG